MLSTGVYSQGFGTDEHEIVVPALFDGDGVTQYYLQVTGYDVDFGDEVSVYLNSTILGDLIQGANNALNAGDVIELPLMETLLGENRIEFRQNAPGFIWGVTGLGVMTAPT